MLAHIEHIMRRDLGYVVYGPKHKRSFFARLRDFLKGVLWGYHTTN
jgi:hypothetical protein